MVAQDFCVQEFYLGKNDTNRRTGIFLFVFHHPGGDRAICGLSDLEKKNKEAFCQPASIKEAEP